jgi:hypothetical protein
MTGSWTTVDQLVAVLRKRWHRGQYLTEHAAGTAFAPISLPVRAPNSTELLHRFDEARRWADQFRRDSHTAEGEPRFRTEYRSIGGLHLGRNLVPARVHIECFAELVALLDASADIVALDRVLAETTDRLPILSSWVIEHPLLAVEHRSIWTDLLSTVAWIAANDTSRLYLRHLDVDGVDTKFVERHRKLLDQLLGAALAPERVDSRYGQRDFARRFGFRPKPAYTRFRLLAPDPSFPDGLTEMQVRTDELARIPPAATTVFVVENEVTYLAFPSVPASIVVFGGGFAAPALAGVPWLASKDIVYWGDIDTHGFDILNRLRASFGSVRSMLMDEETLLAHRRQLVTEPEPTNRRLDHLTEPESALYHDLIEGHHGPGVRLEQERIRFSSVRRALEPWALA